MMVTKEQVKKCLDKYLNDYLSTQEDIEAFGYARECVGNGIVWHPYPDEKPKNESKKYIVTTSCGEVENRWWLNTFWAITVSKVIAWAELPAPYRRENEDGTVNKE